MLVRIFIRLLSAAMVCTVVLHAFFTFFYYHTALIDGNLRHYQREGESAGSIVINSSPRIANAVNDEATPLSLAIVGSDPLLDTAIVTLVTRTEYLIGAYALGMSLKNLKTSVPMVVLLSADVASSHDTRRLLRLSGWLQFIVVERIDNPAKSLLQTHKVDVFTKLRVFELTQLARRLLYLDADAIALRNLDHLLLDEVHGRVQFKFVPEITPMYRCVGGAGASFVFLDSLQHDEFCQAHVFYHNHILPLCNTGVMLLKPDKRVFNDLLELVQREVNESDTCIGTAGCNDQRIINLYYHTSAQHPNFEQLSVLYNVFCDQFLQGNSSVFRRKERPFILHYRGQARLKPWILRRGSINEVIRKSDDECGAFVGAYATFYRLVTTSLANVNSVHYQLPKLVD